MSQKQKKCDECGQVCKNARGLSIHKRHKHEKKFEEFDLEIDSTEKALELVAHMKNLKNTMGWRIMCKMFEGNIALMEKQILNKVGFNGEVLSEEEADVLRSRRGIMMEMVGKPDMIIENYEPKTMYGNEYDPYYIDVKQFGENKRA